MTRDEFLVRDFLANWLYSQYEAGAYRLGAADVAARGWIVVVIEK